MSTYSKKLLLLFDNVYVNESVFFFENLCVLSIKYVFKKSDQKNIYLQKTHLHFHIQFHSYHNLPLS